MHQSKKLEARSFPRPEKQQQKWNLWPWWKLADDLHRTMGANTKTHQTEVRNGNNRNQRLVGCAGSLLGMDISDKNNSGHF